MPSMKMVPYVSNEQDDDMDIIDDIIHELSHAVEQKNGENLWRLQP